ncbi:hypothetical protein GCM10028795_11350 [Lysobacter olei]
MLHAGDVVRVRAMEVAARVGLFVELVQGAVGQHAGHEGFIFGIAAVAPVNRGRARERRDLGHPVVQRRQSAAGPSFDG